MNKEQAISLAEKILSAVGGESNVQTVGHCYTRLRLTLRKTEGVTEADLKAIPGVLSVITRGDEYQIVVGPEVSTLYNNFMTLGEFAEGVVDTSQNRHDPEVKTGTFKDYVLKVLDFIGGTFSPVIPVLIAGGLTGAVLTVLTNFFGVTADSGTYTIISALNQSAFWFLPIYIGFSAARKLNINPYLGAMLGAVLLFSTINGAEGLDFAGIPVHATSYSSTVFPILLGVGFMALVYKFFEKILHQVLKTVFLPLLTMLVVVPVTLVALGPIGDVLGRLLSDGIYKVYELSPPIAVMFVGGLMPFMVFFGMNNALYPLVFALFAAQNSDPLIIAGLLATNISVGATSLAVGIKSSKPELKSVGISAGVTAILGITEPGVYGILFPLKKPLMTAVLSAGLGGLIAGLFKVAGYAIVSPSLASIVSFIPADGSLSNFYYAILVMVVTFIAAFVTTWFFGTEKKEA